MDPEVWRKKVRELVEKAITHEKGEFYEEACEFYKKAGDILIQLIKCKYPPLKIDEKSAGLRDSYKTKLKEYLERAEYLKGVLKKASEPPPPVKVPGGGAGGADDAKE